MPPSSEPTPSGPTRALAWLRSRDRDLAATRRATRAAILMPANFAIGDKVIANPTVATFAAFGSFAMLLLVDFGGAMRDRVRDQALLGVACAALVSLATLCSRSTALAVIAMALVAFVIVFAGVVSSVLASATTALLLSFILPVSLAAPGSAIPDRVAGWSLAAGVSIIAIAVLWPAPRRDPLRGPAIGACRALAVRLRSDVTYALAGPGERDAAEHEAVVGRADVAVAALQQAFFATPYRPTGLGTASRMIVRLVDEIRWLSKVVVIAAPRPDGPAHTSPVCHVRSTAAAALAAGADVLEQPQRPLEELRATRERLTEALAGLEQGATRALPIGGGATDAPADRDSDPATGFIASLEPSFRAQELGFIVSQLAMNVELSAWADRRSWLARLLGRRPAGLAGPLSAAQERAGAHVDPHSVWLHNSVRAAIGLALAVLVAKLTGVQHSFWVVFGALSVLRSNALSTGQNVVRALVGTMIGFVAGAALVSAIGTDTTALWILLPVVVLFAGFAPAAISFIAGQAAFTLVLFILFNIIAPVGWHIGLVRIEDVAIGCAVSLVVGALFWPRGAGTALRRALADSYADSARYLAAAVDFGMSRCDEGTPSREAPGDEAMRAASASRRLDDAFRSYLAERGPKRIPLGDVTTLVTGPVGLRLAGDAVLDLWARDERADGDRAAAREAILARSAHVVSWYDHFASGLNRGGDLPEPMAAEDPTDRRLVDAVGRDLRSADGHTTLTAARMIWTRDHLDAARRLQDVVVTPARTALERPALLDLELG